MIKPSHAGAGLGSALLGLAWVPSAWAGGPIGTIDYEPMAAATSVPTLGEWSLILMALLVAVVAYRALRGRVNGRLLTHLLLGGGLVAGGLAGGGAGMSSADAAATPIPEVDMTQAGGGSVQVIQIDEIVQVNNTAGVPLRIKDMRTSAEYVHWVDPTPSSPECEVGTVVPVGGKCFVRVVSEPV